MSNLKYIMMALLTVSFAFLTACNDGFKSNALVAGENLPRVDKGEEDLDKGVTPAAEDRDAVSDLDAILRIANSDYSADLSLDVEAFSIVRNDRFDDEGIRSMRMEATMLTGCGNNDKVSASGSVDFDDLMDRQVVTIGTSGDYEFLVRCTDNICDELVATIYKKVTNGEYGRVDFGMIGYQVSGTSSSRVVEYASRLNPGRGLIYRGTVANYQRNCLTSDAERDIWGTSSEDDGLDTLWNDPPSSWDNSFDIDGSGPQ